VEIVNIWLIACSSCRLCCDNGGIAVSKDSLAFIV